MNKSSESYKVYTDSKTGHVPSGVIKTQSDGQSRPLPKPSEVSEAQCVEGAHDKAAREQVGLNRYPINKHEEDHKTHGPNN